MQRPRFTVRRLMIAVGAVSVAAWLWVCFGDMIDPELVGYLFMAGSCFLFFAGGAVSLLALAWMVTPRDLPPRPAQAVAKVQVEFSWFRIRTLMIAIALAGLAMGLISFAVRNIRFN